MAAIAFLLAMLITYVKTVLPNVGEALVLSIISTPERIERGKYLAHSVTVYGLPFYPRLEYLCRSAVTWDRRKRR